jgi:hypothetical protein
VEEWRSLGVEEFRSISIKVSNSKLQSFKASKFKKSIIYFHYSLTNISHRPKCRVLK